MNNDINKENVVEEENTMTEAQAEAVETAADDVKTENENKNKAEKVIARKRRFKYGGAATVITVIGIVVIIIINMVATALTDRFGLTVDMTGNSLFKLSEKSIDYVKDIDKDVNIYILLDEDTYKSAGIYYAS